MASESDLLLSILQTQEEIRVLDAQLYTEAIERPQLERHQALDQLQGGQAYKSASAASIAPGTLLAVADGESAVPWADAPLNTPKASWTGENCPNGTQCYEQNFCYSLQDCGPCQWCQDGQCVERDPSRPCEIDNECPCPRNENTRYECVEGTCLSTCLADPDCGECETCNQETGYCQPGCQQDEDCGTGSFCLDCKCVTPCQSPGFCDSNSDCPSGQICRDYDYRVETDPSGPLKHCVSGCRTDEECAVECPPDQACIDECPLDYQCVFIDCDPGDAACVEQCPKDANCVRGCGLSDCQQPSCIDGDCFVPCENDEGCEGETNFCNEGRCEDIGALCIADEDCDGGQFCNGDGRCEFGCRSAGDCEAPCDPIPSCVENCGPDLECVFGCDQGDTDCINKCPVDATCIEDCRPVNCMTSSGVECRSGSCFKPCSVAGCNSALDEICVESDSGDLECIKQAQSGEDSDPRLGCEESYTCNQDGQCEKAICPNGESCPAGSICVDGICQPGCNKDSDCEGDREGRTVCGCEGVCDFPCTSNNECEFPKVCTKEGSCCLACEPIIPCLSADDCPGGEVCGSEGVCITGCDADAQCEPGEVCVDNQCEFVCVDAQDCIDSQRGDTCQDERCTTAQLICLNDGECPNDGEICDSGTCRPGCRVDSQCLRGEVCDREEKACVTLCSTAKDCTDVGAGEACVEGRCRFIAGGGAEICTSCQTCSAIGTCLDIQCVTDDGCPGCSCLSSGLCGKCESDNDCGEGSVCSSDGMCLRPCALEVKCASDQDCSNDQICGPDGIGPYCIDGCRNDSQCPDGQGCFGGQCDSLCNSDEDCGQGEECRDFRCAYITPPEDICSTDGDCESEEVCLKPSTSGRSWQELRATRTGYENQRDRLPSQSGDEYQELIEAIARVQMEMDLIRSQDPGSDGVCGFNPENSDNDSLDPIERQPSECGLNMCCHAEQGYFCEPCFCETSGDCECGRCTDGRCLGRCRSDEECPCGECLNGYCFAGYFGCSRDEECISGNCSDGRCTCNGDAQCKPEETCIDGLCQLACGEGVNCPRDMVCSARGYCIDAECETNADCPLGVCDETGTCVDCLTDRHCWDSYGDTTLLCSDKTCETPCYSGLSSGNCIDGLEAGDTCQNCPDSCPPGSTCEKIPGPPYCGEITYFDKARGRQVVKGIPCVRCVYPCSSTTDCIGELINIQQQMDAIPEVGSPTYEAASEEQKAQWDTEFQRLEQLREKEFERNQACVDGQCRTVDGRCTLDSDCASLNGGGFEFRCSTGECLPVGEQCISSEDCDEDETCFDGYCQVGECSSDDDCQAGKGCANGFCGYLCGESPEAVAAARFECYSEEAYKADTRKNTFTNLIKAGEQALDELNAGRPAQCDEFDWDCFRDFATPNEVIRLDTEQEQLEEARAGLEDAIATLERLTGQLSGDFNGSCPPGFTCDTQAGTCSRPGDNGDLFPGCPVGYICDGRVCFQRLQGRRECFNDDQCGGDDICDRNLCVEPFTGDSSRDDQAPRRGSEGSQQDTCAAKGLCCGPNGFCVNCPCSDVNPCKNSNQCCDQDSGICVDLNDHPATKFGAPLKCRLGSPFCSVIGPNDTEITDPKSQLARWDVDLNTDEKIARELANFCFGEFNPEMPDFPDDPGEQECLSDSDCGSCQNCNCKLVRGTPERPVFEREENPDGSITIKQVPFTYECECVAKPESIAKKECQCENDGDCGDCEFCDRDFRGRGKCKADCDRLCPCGGNLSTGGRCPSCSDKYGDCVKEVSAVVTPRYFDETTGATVAAKTTCGCVVDRANSCCEAYEDICHIDFRAPGCGAKYPAGLVMPRNGCLEKKEVRGGVEYFKQVAQCKDFEKGECAQCYSDDHCAGKSVCMNGACVSECGGEGSAGGASISPELCACCTDDGECRTLGEQWTESTQQGKGPWTVTFATAEGQVVQGTYDVSDAGSAKSRAKSAGAVQILSMDAATSEGKCKPCACTDSGIDCEPEEECESCYKRVPRGNVQASNERKAELIRIQNNVKATEEVILPRLRKQAESARGLAAEKEGLVNSISTRLAATDCSNQRLACDDLRADLNRAQGELSSAKGELNSKESTIKNYEAQMQSQLDQLASGEGAQLESGYDTVRQCECCLDGQCRPDTECYYGNCYICIESNDGQAGLRWINKHTLEPMCLEGENFMTLTEVGGEQQCVKYPCPDTIQGPEMRLGKGFSTRFANWCRGPTWKCMKEDPENYTQGYELNMLTNNAGSYFYTNESGKDAEVKLAEFVGENRGRCEVVNPLGTLTGYTPFYSPFGFGFGLGLFGFGLFGGFGFGGFGFGGIIDSFGPNSVDKKDGCCAHPSLALVCANGEDLCGLLFTRFLEPGDPTTVITKVERDIEQLSGFIAEANSAIAENQSNVEKAQEALQKQRDELSRVQGELDECNSIERNLENQINRLEDAMNRAENDSDRPEDDVAEKSSEINALEDEIEDLLKEEEQLNKMIEDGEAAEKEVTRLNRVASKAAVDLANRINSAKAEMKSINDPLNPRYQDLEYELGILETRLDDAKSEMDDSAAEIAEIREELVDLRKEVNDLRLDDINPKRRLVDSLYGELNWAAQKLANKNQELQSLGGQLYQNKSNLSQVTFICKELEFVVNEEMPAKVAVAESWVASAEALVEANEATRDNVQEELQKKQANLARLEEERPLEEGSIQFPIPLPDNARSLEEAYKLKEEYKKQLEEKMNSEGGLKLTPAPVWFEDDVKG